MEAAVASEASMEGHITPLGGLYLPRSSTAGTWAVRWSRGHQQAISVIQAICVISGMFRPRSQILSQLLHPGVKDDR